MDVRRPASQRRLLVAAAERERFWFAHALRDLRGLGPVAFVPAAELARSASRFEPELIVVSIRGLADGVHALYDLLSPELAGRCVIAAVHQPDARLTRVLDRIGVESCVVTPRDPSALRSRIGDWEERRTRPRLVSATAPGDGNAATEKLVASVVREASEAVSAHDVAADCGLSVVTSRRYLKKLVLDGQAAVDVHHRSVGRPVNLYRWAG